ncbi:MAG: ABC transporter permease, partial [Lachnospira sp.]|nr:ABC transporter permease [Lachnospira sp.]
MKAGFYSRLAIDGIRKNKRLYIPYIFTGMVMVMMSYIVFFLKSTDMLEHMKGGGMLRTMLPLGSVVITVFSLMFMFYSNSFVIRQRNREFGLYNVLGMDKRNLSALMFWENVIVSCISIAGGLVLGIVLSKLAELGMVNILEGEITYTMRIDVMSAVKTVVIFAVIYILLLFNSMIRVRRSNPVEMLKSSNVGEKAPKANWLLAIVGVVILAGAYYIALSIKQPLSAISWFMIAVVMVIVATYLIFISGSVAICRILQRNKNYYYKANHFVSVSSMVYRMKRNGAGLASICILCTMVLVMLSSTVSLYIGAEESIAVRYPNDIAVRLAIPELKHFNEEAFTKMRNSLNSYIPEKENVLEYSVIDVAGLFNNEGIIVDHKSHIGFDVSDYDNVGYVHIISLEDYNRMEGANETLNDGECLLYCYRTEYTADTFKIEGCEPLKVKKVLEEMHATGHDAMLILPMITIVTNNVKGLVEPIADVSNSMGGSILELFWNYSFDIDADAQTEIEVADNIHSHIDDILIKDE